MQIHRVVRGETLRSVAADYGVSPIKLAENNGLSVKDRLIEGEELLILVPTRTANARRGEGLSDISKKFSVKEDMLLGINPELLGRGELYDGQPIAVKYGEQLFGMGIGNGYVYRGCTRERIVFALPYLSYLTVCSGVAKRGGIATLFDDGDAVALARAAGKLPIFRVWIGERSNEADWEKTAKSAAIYAKGRGFHGVSLGGLSRIPTSELPAHMLAAKKIMLEYDLALFAEADLSGNCEATDFADASVLTYDKLSYEYIPSIDEGERARLSSFAQLHDSLRAFVDLSPFALVGKKYITKPEARYAIARCKGEIRPGADGYYMLGTAGRGRGERLYIWEGLKNTYEKLKLVSELGYYGISFDVARAAVYDLLLFRVMFSPGIGVS